MLELYTNIKKYRKLKGMSQQELAEITGYGDRSSIAKIEKGEVDLSQSKILAFAKALEVTPAFLMGFAEKNSYDNLYNISTQRLPLLGSIACGVPIYAEEERESYVMCGTEIKADFCLRCQGDSMINARINDGDIVFIRKQDAVNNGDIAAVIIEDEATLKRFFYYREQGMVILRAENPKYQDIVLTGEALNTITIIGKAVAFQSDVE